MATPPRVTRTGPAGRGRHPAFEGGASHLSDVHASHLVGRATAHDADDHRRSPCDVESSVTAISWIPSEAVTGIADVGFKTGFTHFDEPPPDQLGTDIPASIEKLRAEDRFRFANRLAAFAEFDGDGRCVRHGYDGGGVIGATTVRLGRRFTVAAVPPARPAVAAGDRATAGCGSVRRRVDGPVCLRPARCGARRSCSSSPPMAWTTLELVAPRRRHGRGPAGRRVAVPAALDLRRRRRARRQERDDRFQGLGRARLRPPHAVGRRGLTGARRRRRDGAGTGAVEHGHARRPAADHPLSWPPAPC